MQKKALVVAGAVGDVDPVNEVLQRFGYAGAEVVASLDAAIARLRDASFDLVLVPLDEADAVHLVSLDRVLRQRERTFVIGTAPRAIPDLIVQAMRSGVQEFLISPPDPKELAAAVDRLSRRGEQESARGMTLAVYSAKGGLGTTSVAINLAHALARQHSRSRVALVDFVVSGGDLRVLLNLKSTYDMGDLMARMEAIDADLLTSLLTPLEGGVWALPASERPELAELVDANATSTIIDQLRSNFAFSVLDCEHHLTERTLAALDHADKILLVSQLNVAALRSTQRTIELAQRLGYRDDKLCIVVNRHYNGDVVSLADAAELLGRPVYFHLPNDYRVSANAQAKGVPVAVHDGSSKLSQAYTALAGKLAAGSTPASNGTAATASSRLGKLLSFGKK